jgi:mannose/fructose/sorbose-specific phosphotransferase system IIA component
LVGIVIVTHGEMAEGLLDAARSVTGHTQGSAVVCLRDGDAVDALETRIAAAIEAVNDGDGVLVLVDMWGASPFNAAARLTLRAQHPIEVIAGVNLPMVVELLVQRAAKGFDELVAIALQAGSEGVRALSQALANGQEC